MNYLDKSVKVPKELSEFLAALEKFADGVMAAAKDNGKVDFSEGVALLPEIYAAAKQYEGVSDEVKADPEAAAVAALLWASSLVKKLRS